MRKHVFSSLVLLLSVLYGHAQKAKDFTWKAQVKYIVNTEHQLTKEPGKIFLDIAGFSGKQSEANYREMMEYLFTAATSGKAPVYMHIWDEGPDFSKLVSPEDIKSMLSTVDTAMVEDFETGVLVETIMSSEITADDFSAVYLNQEWFYNEEEKKLEVVITDAGFLYNVFDESGNLVGTNPLCYFKYKERTRLNGGSKQRVHLPEILWAGSIPLSISEDTTRANGELSLHSSSDSGDPALMKHYKVMYGKRLAQHIYAGAASGKLQAYKTADLKQVMSTSDVREAGATIDTMMVEDFETGELVQIIEKNKIDERDAIALLINQSITFDSKSVTFESVINSAAVMIPVWDESGNDVGRRALFWVKF